MMASNILSRLLPAGTGSPSIYETFRQLDESSDANDAEERAGMASVDEENLGNNNLDLDPAIAEAMSSQLHSSQPAIGEGHNSRYTDGRTPGRRKERRLHWSPRIAEADEADDEVPLSLLVEGNRQATPMPFNDMHRSRQQDSLGPVPMAGPATGAARAKWQTMQQQQQLYQGSPVDEVFPARRPHGRHPLAIIDPKEKAMWMWANVVNLDNFLKDVYDYYLGNGIWCILLYRMLNLLTLAFVVGFGTFLTSCINYSELRNSTKMEEILIKQCTKKMSGFANFLIWIFAFLWIAKFFQYILDIQRLRQMQDFYQYLLEIQDTDIQTISWQDVVKRLMSLRDSNPSTAAKVTEQHRRFIGSQSKQRMDAHDIANRLMRRENYLIALFNKDVLDLTLPVPFLGNRQFFSKTLEWNLDLCIMDYVFNEQGQVRSIFLKDTHRKILSEGLRRRFLFAGFMNVICAPFIIVYFILLYFFRYFNEYQRNPSQLGSRQYTPLAEWKFREFNELWHLFERRINMSYPFASRYIDQFPKEKTVQLSRFVAFITGALASVLALASVIDPELFLGFEITSDRTVLFYLGVFGTIWAIARGAVPEENLVFDPEYALNNVTDYTHYLPSQWKGRMHSDEVRKEFAQLYQMKVVIFLEELISIIFTPFILWFSLPICSDKIVDFFREFTLHVDGLGHVCSFAVFDFKKGGNNLVQGQQREGDPGQDLRDDYYSTKDGKMLASYYGFIDNYVTNPKAGAPYLHSAKKHQFHPPPSFPNLMVRGESQDRGPPRADPWDRQRSASRPAGPSIPGTASARTPRFAPIINQPSPMTSILLDPQHQPPPSTLRQVTKAGGFTRLQASRHQASDLLEDNEDGDEEPPEDLRADTSEGPTYSSNLGESWKTTQAAVDEESGEVGPNTSGTDKGPGVLGLVYQFSKAQTEGRGTGVNI